MAEHGKHCPIMVAGGNMYVSQCIGKDCTWWLPYANDCALPVVAGILADSAICQNALCDTPNNSPTNCCPNCGAKMDLEE